jgi:hypothetical protein
MIFYGAAASAQVITNEEVIIYAARSGIENNFGHPDFKSINIRVLEGEISRPVAAGIAEGFRNIGVNVIGNDYADSAVQYAECDVLGFDFAYGNGDSRGFLRKRMIKREFTAKLKFTLYDAGRRLISEIKDVSLKYEDQINPGLANLVKSRTIEALDPPSPSSGMKKFIEPVIVTATIGGLVFLFFANR